MAYIYFDPKYKMMSFALVHNFPQLIGINWPFTYHLFYHILSGTFRVPLGRVNVTRVALTVLSQIAFANVESLCIFLTVHIKEIFNKFVAKTHIPSHCSATESRKYEIARMGDKFILHAMWMKARRESNRSKQEGSISFLFPP